MADDFKVTSEGEGMVRIHTDAPGERATSTVTDAWDAILAIAEAANLNVQLVVDEGEAPADEVDLSVPQPGEPQVGEDTPEVPIEGEDEDPPAF